MKGKPRAEQPDVSSVVAGNWPLATPALVEEVFRQGRRLEAAHICAQAERICDRMLREVDAEVSAPMFSEAVDGIEEVFANAPSSLAAARRGGARAALLALRSELGRYLREEQDAIERHEMSSLDRKGLAGG